MRLPQTSLRLLRSSYHRASYYHALRQATTPIVTSPPTFPNYFNAYMELSPEVKELISGPLKIAGPIFFFLLQISTSHTAYVISKTKSTGSMSPIPFISLSTNCAIWSLYGYATSDPTVFYPNLSGFFVGIISTYIFHKNMNENTPKPWAIYSGAICILALSLCLFVTSHTPFIGTLGCALSVAVSGSPLAVLKTVIMEKSTAALPFATSLIMWLNSISWLLYGSLIAHDVLLWGPNLLGFVLSSIQMLLFGLYPSKKMKDGAYSEGLLASKV